MLVLDLQWLLFGVLVVVLLLATGLIVFSRTLFRTRLPS